jgi:hypothetical protein
VERTITLTIPSDWLKGETVDQDELRKALILGLAQLRQGQTDSNVAQQAIQALLSTGRVRHLSAALVQDEKPDADRQPPPELPGPPVSEILIAQRRGDL